LVQIGSSITSEWKGLKFHIHFWEHYKNGSFFKAQNSNMDFDRIMALFELRIFNIIQALVLLSSTLRLVKHSTFIRSRSNAKQHAKVNIKVMWYLQNLVSMMIKLKCLLKHLLLFIFVEYVVKEMNNALMFR
jgi:hypothetical protein